MNAGADGAEARSFRPTNRDSRRSLTLLQNVSQVSIPKPHPWFAVRVKPNFERTAAAGLAGKGFEPFLATYGKARKWSDRVKNVEFPLFPGYLFCRFAPAVRTPILSTPGVLHIVSFGSELMPVSEAEIEALRRVAHEGLPVEPWPFLNAGQRAFVSRGALKGAEGIVVEAKTGCRLILQVSLLQRSVSVEIDRDCLIPIDEPGPQRPKLAYSRAERRPPAPGRLQERDFAA
jgi:transcriptional antiterminator NusG